MILQQIRATVTFVGILSLITGILYPLFVTGVGQLLFPFQANGSIIINQGKAVGSSLIGQQFTSEKYFWGRPSATSPTPYNALNSSGSNLSPTNPELVLNIKARLEALLNANPNGTLPVPLDLVTASGSGLDPHISIKGALFQAPRIAKQRQLDINLVKDLISKHSKSNSVNVLMLNIALDELQLQRKNSL
jgi:potassium-transporting ATPase KdpC subunit